MPPEIAVQVVESQETGKYRVLVTVHKDEWLDVAFLLNADQANALAIGLSEASRQARGKSIVLPGGGLAN
jgi:hypothetical protein